MNTTEKLLQNMTVRDGDKVIVFDSFEADFKVSDLRSTATPGRMMVFSISWSCEQFISQEINDSDLEKIKLLMVGQLKNSMYRDIVNELYAIHRSAMSQPYHNQDLIERVMTLINELR